ncbi:glycosylphosphatidylinositol anchored membrane protein boudin isoform X2 [Lycorma delicatula]|uniref:glycosylphosphatidylinositol anchored membrane protein boudin isoform X2 n=1 Tax=Lycorma delicatula TaxID=130591 RepID=UPI003F50E5B4
MSVLSFSEITIFVTILLTVFFRTVGSINCYECSTPLNIDCGDILIHDQDGKSLTPTSCDHLFEARYCIKTTGIYKGGLGTKRFCSSLDLGNYCNDIQQPGDELEYRSCVYTCSSDGCNDGVSLKANIVYVSVFSVVMLLSL